jgi:glycine betaine/proline transport system substrate-binding protein
MPASLAIGVSAPFKAQYPDLVAFFEKVDLPIDLLNQTLGQMSEKRLQPRQVAEAFLRDQPQIWKGWVPGEVADRVTVQLLAAQ